MPFNQALRLSSVLLAAASFIGLSLGTNLPEWLVLFTGSALIVSLLRILGADRLRRVLDRIRLSTTAWNILTVIAFAGFWADLLWVSADLLQAGVHFLLILMVIKLFNLDQRRDYLHLYAISLMAILGSAASTTDLWYVPVFLAYLLMGVWTLLLYQLTKESDGKDGTPSLPNEPALIFRGREQITPELFWLANSLAGGALCLTVLIFFTIPRVSAGFGQKGSGEGIRTSGFSETVNLGMIGPIKRDPGIVMRVELPDRTGLQMDRFYLRGMAYDRYDGKSWTTRLSHRRALAESPVGTFTVRHASSRSPRPLGQVIRQTILLEALDTAVLFAAPHPESISGQFLAIQSDPTGAIYLPFPSATRLEYTVHSRTTPVAAADLQFQPAVYTEVFGQHFLQLPESSERVGALAREIVGTKTSAYEKAQAIETYLSRHYRYSLDISPGLQARPLEEFLFERKTGYCEHYATAMVVLLRNVGVPARLVTGFLATEWNEYGNYYLVRQRDAHAWVEVHLPSSGWVTMDPTPAVSEAVGDSQWFAASRVIDTLRLRWNRFFVQYNAADQLAVMRGLKEGTTVVRDRAWSSLSSLVAPAGDFAGKLLSRVAEGNVRLTIGFLSCIVLGLGLAIWLVQRKPWNRWRHADPIAREHVVIGQIYRGVLKQIARHGISKPQNATPQEFLRLVRQQWAVAGESVGTITELYCRGRFGKVILTQQEIELAYRSLKQLALLDPPVHS
ncbi:MAG: TGc domain-containing protein [Nitrospira sp.]|nr:MAG: TGc domain-containing protein [Nitrospira sp.]